MLYIQCGRQTDLWTPETPHMSGTISLKPVRSLELLNPGKIQWIVMSLRRRVNIIEIIVKTTTVIEKLLLSNEADKIHCERGLCNSRSHIADSSDII